MAIASRKLEARYNRTLNEWVLAPLNSPNGEPPFAAGPDFETYEDLQDHVENTNAELNFLRMLGEAIGEDVSKVPAPFEISRGDDFDSDGSEYDRENVGGKSLS